MPPEAERQMARGVVPPDVEAERVGEDVLVAVGGGEGQVQQVAGLERGVPQGEGRLAVAHEVLDGRDVPDELVGGGVDQLGFRLEQLQLVGVLEQGQQATRDDARSRVVAGRGDDDVVAERVHVRQRFAPHLRVGDDRRQVAGRVGPAVGGQLGEVVHEVEQDRHGCLVLHRPGHVGVFGPEELLGQLEHPRVVVLGQAEDGQDHVQREVDGDIVGEVTALAHGRHPVDRRAGQRVDAVLHALDVAGLEPVVDDVAVGLVLVTVHLDERLDRRVGHVVQPRFGHERRHRCVGEEVGVPLDLHHVRMRRQRPELGVSRHRHLQDRRRVADLLRRRMPCDRIGIGGGVGEDGAEAVHGGPAHGGQL